jgi:hypothetical protein
MTTYAAQGPGLAEQALTFHNAVNGDKFTNDGYTMLIVRNADDDTNTIVSVDDVGTPEPDEFTAFNPDVPISAAFGTIVAAGPFPRGRFNDPNGAVTLNFSSTVGVSWAAVSTKVI